MEQLRAEQKEALQVAKEYMVKLTTGMEELVLELRGNRKPDTDDFMKQCMDGLNWIIQVYNRTSDLINEGKVRIVKEQVNDSILRFNEVVKEKDEERMAEVLETEIVIFLRTLASAIEEVL